MCYSSFYHLFYIGELYTYLSSKPSITFYDFFFIRGSLLATAASLSKLLQYQGLSQDPRTPFWSPMWVTVNQTCGCFVMILKCISMKVNQTHSCQDSSQNSDIGCSFRKWWFKLLSHNVNSWLIFKQRKKMLKLISIMVGHSP